MKKQEMVKIALTMFTVIINFLTSDKLPQILEAVRTWIGRL